MALGGKPIAFVPVIPSKFKDGYYLSRLVDQLKDRHERKLEAGGPPTFYLEDVRSSMGKVR